MRFSLPVVFVLFAAVGFAQPPATPPGTPPAPTPTASTQPASTPPASTQPASMQPPATPPAPTPPSLTPPSPMPAPTTGTPSSPAAADAQAAPAPLQVTDENRNMILMLIDRVQKLSTDAMGASKTGALTGGKVTIGRSALDEIVADLSQIRTILSR